MKCPICDKEVSRFYGHLLKNTDSEHNEILQKQTNLILKLFSDIEFNNKANLNDDFGVLFAYSTCLNIWKQHFGLAECKLRANRLNGRNVSKAKKGKKLSEEHKKALSESHKGQIPWNKGRTVNNDPKVRAYRNTVNQTMSKVLKEKYKNGEMTAWLKDKSKENNPELVKMYSKVSKTMAGKIQVSSYGISGIRKDIGHFAASTYEANVYRILQYHNSDYLKEHEIIHSIKHPNGDIKDYRVDILDINGVFGTPGAYLEVKGFLKERDKEKIKLFKDQYPEKTLLLLGRGDKRDQYFWEPDIDYSELEKKYKPLIPLWEDKNQNLKTHPELYKIL